MRTIRGSWRSLALAGWLLLLPACHTLNTGIAPANAQRGFHKAIYANQQEYQRAFLEPYLHVLNSLFGNGVLFGNYKIPLHVTELPRGTSVARIGSTCLFWVICWDSDSSGKMPVAIHSVDAQVQTFFLGLYVERELIINGHQSWAGEEMEDQPLDAVPEGAPPAPQVNPAPPAAQEKPLQPPQP